MKVPDNKQLCGYEPDELVTCDIRARRESNSQGNRDSEISRDSVTTDCASESHDINILLCPYVIFTFLQHYLYCFSFTIPLMLKNFYKSNFQYLLKVIFCLEIPCSSRVVYISLLL